MPKFFLDYQPPLPPPQIYQTLFAPMPLHTSFFIFVGGNGLSTLKIGF